MTGETPSADPNVRVTYFPGPQHVPITPGTEVLLIDAAQVEFAMLRQLGVDVPEVSLSLEGSTLENPQITVTTPVVEGEQFPPGWKWPALGTEAPHQEEAASLAEILISYYRRVVIEQPEFFLGAIADVQHYAVTPSGRLALTNPIPLMISGNSAVVQRNVQAQLAIMKDWIRNIQYISPTRETDIRAQLENLMAILEIR